MSIAPFFAPGGPLAHVVGESYSYRPEQVRFAEAVADTLSNGGALLADCPTSTGKSFGYLVPAALSGKKVVVSTGTKVLQAQLVDKDLPVLHEAMLRASLKPPSFALMKGRGDFLCYKRFEEYVDHATLEDLEVMDELEAWRSTTLFGDKERLPLAVPTFWPDIAADADDCHRKTCDFSESCYYFAHKDRVLQADILVVNHALLLANVATGGAIFAMEDRHLILDEAHSLEGFISEAFGARVSRYRINYVCRVIERKVSDIAKHTERVKSYAASFFEELKTHTELGSLEDAPPSYSGVRDALLSVRALVRSNPREEVNQLGTMVSKLLADLASFFDPPEDTHAYAVQLARERGAPPVLQSWLVEPAEIFCRGVLKRDLGAATVLTSATLAVGGSFDYPKKRLGFDQFEGYVAEHQGRDIFDYHANCLIYLEQDLVPPVFENTDLFMEQSLRRAAELVKTSDGRALILLSTWKALRRFKDEFRELVDPYEVKFQGDESPSRLIGWLKNTSGAVLVGTRTFWEGVDVPGDALSMLIIDKVPFPPPDDPVVKKLCQKAGNRWFIDVSLPRAQMALEQGKGRLIRTHTDRGVVDILDSRIRHKAWGRRMRCCLPKGAAVTSSVADVGMFYSDPPEAA